MSGYNECPCCFLITTLDEEEKTYNLCEVCEAESLHHNSHLKRRLVRILEILHKTHASRFPEVLRIMYDSICEDLDKKANDYSDY